MFRIRTSLPDSTACLLSGGPSCQEEGHGGLAAPSEHPTLAQPAPSRNHLKPSTQFSLPQCPFKMQIDSLICLENTKAVPLQKCETRRFSEAGNTNSSTFVHSKQYGREEAGARVRNKHPMCYVWALNIAQRLAKRIS